MNAYINKMTKIPIELVMIVAIAVVVVLAGLSLSAMPAQQSDMITEASVEIREGQILNLANLPESMILPNGMVLEDVVLVSEGSLAGTISATAIFEEETEPLKMTWLDENGNEISYSSHTVLNSPSYHGIDSGEPLRIWPLFGAQKLKIEI